MLTFVVPLLFALALIMTNVAKKSAPDSEAEADISGSMVAPRTAGETFSEAGSLEGSIVGVASVVDGDTIEVHGTRIRLHGIDAPESGQLCTADGAKYGCGQKSALYLQETLGRSTVTCEARDTDRYGRTIATCSVHGTDVGTIMVAGGWALAYRRYDDVYVPMEVEAAASRRGMWRGEFIEPARWRAGERL
jgi:endonuclease YncB( thermonuclease family)